ncbi:hypothetical protein ACE3MZ_12885 [Paenibacillus sp. WLX1005]|uniref:hypothetical protein n=1 Tax=Paenibacillus sp. WLX1005 TaxID=3243766 RepID=UPI0039844F60
MMINNVATINFPVEMIDGEEQYPLHSAAVVESIADAITDEVKASVTIDYEQIPADYFLKVKQELGIRAVDHEKAAQHEQKLLDMLNHAGAFPNHKN